MKISKCCGVFWAYLRSEHCHKRYERWKLLKYKALLSGVLYSNTAESTRA